MPRVKLRSLRQSTQAKREGLRAVDFTAGLKPRPSTGFDRRFWSRRGNSPPGWRRYKTCSAGAAHHAEYRRRAAARSYEADGGQHAKYVCRAQHAVPLRQRKAKQGKTRLRVEKNSATRRYK
jgi:hypothetical protein